MTIAEAIEELKKWPPNTEVNALVLDLIGPLQKRKPQWVLDYEKSLKSDAGPAFGIPIGH